jgi:hypothetical protein
VDVFMIFRPEITITRFQATEQLKKDPEPADMPVAMPTTFSSIGGESTIPRSRGYTLEAEDRTRWAGTVP